MTKEEKAAIFRFFRAVEDLKELKVIRSDKFLGDIAEFICRRRFGMKLARSGRQPGYDGLIGNKKVQVKFHGGSTTTVDCGTPSKYDELIVILGPNSAMRPPNAKNKAFLIYRIQSADVSKKKKHLDGKIRYTKLQLQKAKGVENGAPP